MASHTRILDNLQQVDTKRINVGMSERKLSALAGGLAAIYGLTRRDPFGLALALLGGAVVYRGLSGSCAVYSALGIDTTDEGGQKPRVPVREQITINLPPEEIYQFWRNFENLPKFMRHLKSVQVSGERHSHWVAKAPAGTTAEWDAEIVDDVENECISWRSLPGAQVENSGEVRFRPAPAGRGTELEVRMSYQPPAGPAGVLLAKLSGEEPSMQIHSDLKRLKSLLETGEIPTVDGQPSARAHGEAHGSTARPDVAAKPNQLGPRNTVTKALEDTFPASDPLAVTQTPGDQQGIDTDEREIGIGKKIY